VSEREVRIERLVGRRVRDSADHPIGRIEEMICEIELHAHGRDYVVREVHLGAFGVLESLAGSVLARELLRKLGRSVGYTRYAIPWEWLDLADPDRPRVTRRRDELTVVD
jgi:hypothetical protein